MPYWAVPLILWRDPGHIHHINSGILFAMANYVLHITGMFHCKWYAWSRQLLGSGGHHRLSTVGIQTVVVWFTPVMTAIITRLP